MDDQISTTSSTIKIVKFIPSDKFLGSKFGYIFTKGQKGLGYYHDPTQKHQPTNVRLLHIMLCWLLVTLCYLM